MDPLQTADDPLIGKTLSGRFRILEPIGAGGMGRVYKAIQTELDRLVALKVLNPQYSSERDPGFVERFKQEARLTARLTSPYTVKVHDFGQTDDGTLYIAMEYVQGETLAQMLTKVKALPWMRALTMAGQIARSLREAHKLGIIHRDLKPANVMVLHEETGSDMIKVLDFGLVKRFLPGETPQQFELTQAGVLLGSPLYMAPESAKGEADPRSDIYSLGVLLFQVIAGKTPFTGKDSIDIIVQHIREAPPKLKSYRPDLPDDVEQLVMKCLEKEPHDRFQSMDEVLDELKRIASALGQSGAFTDPRSQVVGGSSAPYLKSGLNESRRSNPARSIEVQLQTGDVTAPNSRRRLTLFIAGGAVAAVVVLSVVGFVTRRPKASPRPPPVITRPVEPVRPPPPPAVVVPKPPDPPRPPVPEVVAMVTFEVKSTPPGATVSLEGKPVGTTPFSLPLKADADGNLKVQLSFQLEGYQSATAVAEGRGTVQVSQTLKKRPQGKRRPPKESGFKDDPYQ